MNQFFKVTRDRYFQDSEVIIESEYDDIKLPRRATKGSSGYDFYSPFDFVLPVGEKRKIFTGIKVCLDERNELLMYIRSGHGINKGIQLLNCVGKIDSDYYNNDGNEGHICIAFKNEGDQPWTVKKGDAIAQGTITRYELTIDDEPLDTPRNGGLGSTSTNR